MHLSSAEPTGYSVPATSRPTAHRRRIPELDGIRAISILFVLLVHLTYGGVSGGFLGVDIFFVLSGYLITMLLLQELEHSGTIDLRKFYIRRVLRIFPSLILAVGLGLLLSFTPEQSGNNQSRRIAAVLLFHGNFLPAEIMGNLVHTWSLAIEEQFYLVWPALLLLTGRKQPLLPIVIAVSIVVASVLVRVWMNDTADGRSAIYTFTFSRIDSIMVGCLVAIAGRPAFTMIKTIGHTSLSIVAWSSLVILVVALVFATRDFMQNQPLGFLGFAIASAIFILTCAFLPATTWLARFLRHSASQWLGQRSYGIYLYHYPIFMTVETFRQPGDLVNFIVIATIKVLTTFAFAELAWRLVEKPVLALKGRLLQSPPSIGLLPQLPSTNKAARPHPME